MGTYRKPSSRSPGCLSVRRWRPLVAGSPSVKSVVKQLWRDTLDVVFPRSCVHCRGLVEGGGLRHLCATCERTLPIVEAPHCTTCGHPFHGEMLANRLCEHCETLVPEFGEGKTAILLKGPGRALIHALKYHHGLHVLEDITTLMRRTPGYAAHLRGAVLVPVPLHPRKLRARGWNPAALLARPVAGALGVPLQTRWLQRVRETAVQAGLSRDARLANVRGAFQARPAPPSRVLLIDDVRTTGATLLEAAACLEAVGHTVSTLSFAWALQEEDAHGGGQASEATAS